MHRLPFVVHVPFQVTYLPGDAVKNVLFMKLASDTHTKPELTKKKKIGVCCIHQTENVRLDSLQIMGQWQESRVT